MDIIKQQFPILDQKVNGYPLVYLDNAATTQKPLSVIQAMVNYYRYENANVHRAVHSLSARSTRSYENAREKIAELIHAESSKECIFVRGTTEAINLVANGYRDKINEGDNIIISHLEHHSNIVPWQVLCEVKKAQLKIIPVTESGEIDIKEYKNLISSKTKIISICHISNTLGTILPVKEMTHIAHQYNIPVFVDGAQGPGHRIINVKELDCDFYAFSGHKMYAPMGIGVLYGKKDLLDKIVPYQTGGDMVLSVSFDKIIYNELPFYFEAGTPNVGGAIGLAAAIDFIKSIGYGNIMQHEYELTTYLEKHLKSIDGLKLIGEAKNKIGICSFIIEDIHPHDLGTIVDQYGVAIRTGHHCTMPLMERFKVTATSRASIGVYNTKQDVDKLIKAIYCAKKIFKR